METIEELFRKVLDDGRPEGFVRAGRWRATGFGRFSFGKRLRGCSFRGAGGLEGMFREELGDELLDEVNGGMAKYRLYLHEPFLKTTSAASQKIKIIKG